MKIIISRIFGGIMNYFLYILAGFLLIQTTGQAQDTNLSSVRASYESLIIATTRKPVSVNQIAFGKENSDNLYYVKALFQNGKWELHLVDSLSKVLKELNKSRDNLIYIHGDGQSFNDVLESGLRMIKLYKLNIILFDYPSEDNEVSSIKNFFISRENAKRSVTSFSRFLLEIEEFNNQYKFTSDLSILFHSLGNEVLKNYASRYDIKHVENILFENIIMNAPAVKYKNHHKWVSRVNMHQNLYVVHNKKDFILSGAFLITMNRQLGKKIGKKNFKKAVYVSMEKVAGRKHNFFIDKELLEKSLTTKYFFENVLHGSTPDLNSICTFKKKSKRNNIYIIKNDNACNFSKALQVNKESNPH